MAAFIFCYGEWGKPLVLNDDVTFSGDSTVFPINPSLWLGKVAVPDPEHTHYTPTAVSIGIIMTLTTKINNNNSFHVLYYLNGLFLC